MIPDAELLHRYAEESSEAAFTELVQRHLGFVYAAALRQLGGATHRAEEVTQSVFIDLARKSATLSRRTEIVGWLYTSTHYAAAKLKRTEQRRQQREEEAHAMNETPFDHADSSDWDRLRPVLDEAMHALGTDDRTALLLRYFQDRRFAEVGSHLGLTEDAARMRVDRALDKLRALLARRQITSTTAALGLILASQPGVAVPASLLASVTGAALAGAGTVGVGTAAILVFMKTKTAIATLAAVLAVGFAVYETREARHQRTAATAATLERETLRTQLRAAQQSLAAADQKTAELRREIQTFRSLKNVQTFTAPSAVITRTTSRPDDDAGTLTLSNESIDPVEARRKQRASWAQYIDVTYAELYRRLDWTPAQREQFKNLMLDQDEFSAGLFKSAAAAARAQNPKIDRAGLFEVLEVTLAQIQIEQQAATRRTFGDATAETLAHYQATASVRKVTSLLAITLRDSASPITSAQTDQLIEVLARHSPGAVTKIDLLALDIDGARHEAEMFLNPPQITELQRVATRVKDQARSERERNTAPTAPPVSPRR
jgi:RNA polymerase sigma factor (sigma-70 family)